MSCSRKELYRDPGEEAAAASVTIRTLKLKSSPAA
jgi:hypothetical protein